MIQKIASRYETMSFNFGQRRKSPLELAKFEKKTKKQKGNLLEKANFTLKK